MVGTGVVSFYNVTSFSRIVLILGIKTQGSDIPGTTSVGNVSVFDPAIDFQLPLAAQAVSSAIFSNVFPAVCY